MDSGTLLLLALMLVCPLAIFWMMRGHGKKTETAHPHEEAANRAAPYRLRVTPRSWSGTSRRTLKRAGL